MTRGTTVEGLKALAAVTAQFGAVEERHRPRDTAKRSRLRELSPAGKERALEIVGDWKRMLDGGVERIPVPLRKGMCCITCRKHFRFPWDFREHLKTAYGISAPNLIEEVGYDRTAVERAELVMCSVQRIDYQLLRVQSCISSINKQLFNKDGKCLSVGLKIGNSCFKLAQRNITHIHPLSLNRRAFMAGYGRARKGGRHG